jgi:hypothetical protein
MITKANEFDGTPFTIQRLIQCNKVCLQTWIRT